MDPLWVCLVLDCDDGPAILLTRAIVLVELGTTVPGEPWLWLILMKELYQSFSGAYSKPTLHPRSNVRASEGMQRDFCRVRTCKVCDMRASIHSGIAYE